MLFSEIADFAVLFGSFVDEIGIRIKLIFVVFVLQPKLLLNPVFHFDTIIFFVLIHT